MDRDGYWLFEHFWWLIFPLMSLLWGMAGLWSSHQRTNRILDMVKSYVDQGKEPPAELLQLLQRPGQSRYWNGSWQGANPGPGDWSGYHRTHKSWFWFPIFFFASLAAGFAAMAMWPGRERGLIFVAILMGGICLGNVVAMLTRKDSDNLPK